MPYPHNSANVVHDQRSPPPPPNSQPPPPFMQSHQQPQAFPPVSQIHGQQPSIYGQPPPPFMQGHQQPQAFPPVSQIHGQQPSIYGQPQPNYSQQYPPPQPQYYYHQSQMQHAPTGIPVQLSTQPGAWSTGLCDCFTNCHNCFITHWCPCITFGKIAEIVDRGSMSCAISGALYALIQYMTGCGCIYAGYYRQKMRRQFNLPAEPCDDYILHFCCDFCALCQEYRELKHRGFDMSLGWQGNIEKNPALTIAPFIQPGMTR